MGNEANKPPLRQLNHWQASGIILAALYVPQSWYCLMDYPWGSYQLFWLKFVPGLPAFFPVAMIAHPNDAVMLATTWLVTAVTGVGLFILSRRSVTLFGILAIVACVWSTISAVVAYTVFRA